MAHLVFFKGQ